MATTRTYQELVDLVRNWSNRDPQVLPDAIIRDTIRYAVDRAYRTLRIPPLEYTVLYTNADALNAASIGEGNIYQSVTALSVPADLIEFKHIRGTDANGLTTRVFNEKTDIRSFWDICNRHYSPEAFWSRQGDQVLITPAFSRAARGFYGGGAGTETQIEMFYYRRLPALDATFSNALQNWLDNLGGFRTIGTTNALERRDASQSVADQTTRYNTLLANANMEWVGDPVPNWFKDENEKVALYGALSECFSYLQEDDQAGKYLQLFNQEIIDLNDEDRQRDSSGGNVQVQYTARGLI